MANNTSCTGCNACQNCNSCQDACQSSAQSVTTLCNNTFSFRNSGISNNQNSNSSLFLSADEWNSLITYVYNAYKMRLGYSSTKEQFSQYTNLAQYESDNENYSGDIRAGSSYNNGRNEFMTAHMANGILAKMYFFNTENSALGNNAVYGGPDGTVITAEYFNNLSSYANGLTIKAGDRCVSCNTCQYCNTNICSTTTTCQSCDSCESDTPDSGGGE